MNLHSAIARRLLRILLYSLPVQLRLRYDRDLAKVGLPQLNNLSMTTTATPLSPGGKHDFILPVPPPLLHTRSGNELYDRPHTPTHHGFTSPSQTPQGSPSKNRLPPGANDLPNVFDNAMKLMPSSPTKIGRQQLTPNSPNKNGVLVDDNINDTDDSIIHKGYSSTPGSPTRQSNKENTPSGVRAPREATYTLNRAAASRQEPYQRPEQADPAGRKGYNPQRGLSAEELEKLQLPKVKRLANVTQLCMPNLQSSKHQN